MKKCSKCPAEIFGSRIRTCANCKQRLARAKRVRAVLTRRRKLKQLAIEYKGGRCIICGYDKYPGALDFHHTDPKQKDFGLSSSGITRSWARVKEELDKCILVCANCHREIHAGLHEVYAPHEFITKE